MGFSSSEFHVYCTEPALRSFLGFFLIKPLSPLVVDLFQGKDNFLVISLFNLCDTEDTRTVIITVKNIYKVFMYYKSQLHYICSSYLLIPLVTANSSYFCY